MNAKEVFSFEKMSRVSRIRLALSFVFRDMVFPMPCVENAETLEQDIVKKMCMDGTIGEFSCEKYRAVRMEAVNAGFDSSTSRRVVLHVLWGDVCMRVADREARKVGVEALKKHFAPTSLST